jgi:hypothetical protein
MTKQVSTDMESWCSRQARELIAAEAEAGYLTERETDELIHLVDVGLGDIALKLMDGPSKR